jgi:hypothetical protein
MSSPIVIEPFAKPKEIEVKPEVVEPDPAESASPEIPALALIDTPASVVVDRGITIV